MGSHGLRTFVARALAQLALTVAAVALVVAAMFVASEFVTAFLSATDGAPKVSGCQRPPVAPLGCSGNFHPITGE